MQVVPLLALLALGRGAAAADPYEAALEQARAAEAAGDLDGAAAALAGARARYPQDYTLLCALGRLALRRGQLDEAEARYGEALALSGAAGPEARAGLEAVRGARAPALSLGPRLASTFVGYGGNPLRERALVVGAGLSLLERRGAYAAVDYRHGWLSAPGGAAAWGQDELYLQAGWAGATTGAGLQYARVDDGSGVQGTSQHLGASGRLGGGHLAAALSLYADGWIARVVPAWRLALGSVSLTPALAVTGAAGEALLAPSLTLALDRPGFALYAGGKLGAEVRPVDLEAAVTQNVPERVAGGIHAGGSVRLGRLRLSAAWSLDRLERAGTSQVDHAQAVSLGLGATF